MEAHLDFETRSPVDLRKSGVYPYAEHKDTDAWGFSWRIGNDGPISQWRPGYPDPQPLLDHVAAGGRVVAHNAAFERAIWNWNIRVKIAPHWPVLHIQQQDCTMARAAAVAHPQQLDQLAQVVGSRDAQKDKEGYALMMKMAKPRKFMPDGTIQWWDEPENINRLMDYCDQDVVAETDIDAKIPPLTDSEREVWMFDQVINDRGIPIDTVAAEKASLLVEHAKKEADKIMRELTGRAVPRCTNDNKLIAWLQGRGLNFDTVKKGVLDDIIFMAGLQRDPLVKDVIELRRSAKKTSTAKYAAMLKCVCSDGVIRGLLNYHGASTGRWAGRLVQPQNFPRVDYDKEGYIFEWINGLFKDEKRTTKEVYDMISTVHGKDKVLVLMSRALRSMICAPEGKQLIGGDFSNIEGRVNAWLAGEHWKLQAFSDYDAGTGQDLYKLAYAKSFNFPIEEIEDKQRQIGKVQELALGFQGSIGAYMQMGDTYGVDPYELSPLVYEATDAATWDLTAAEYERTNNKYNLFEKEWTAIKVLVNGWRKANPAIVQSWWDYQDAAIEAVSAQGYLIPVAGGRVQYYFDGRCLWCILPGGRMLCYSAPEIVSERQVYTCKYSGETKERWRKKVTFWGRDSKTGRWAKQSLYGGLQCENIVQATARDAMVDRMLAVESKGYPVILTVHDEIVALTSIDRSDLNAQDFQDTMSHLPEWAAGLPISVKAWEHERYVK